MSGFVDPVLRSRRWKSTELLTEEDYSSRMAPIKEFRENVRDSFGPTRRQVERSASDVDLGEFRPRRRRLSFSPSETNFYLLRYPKSDLYPVRPLVFDHKPGRTFTDIPTTHMTLNPRYTSMRNRPAYAAPAVNRYHTTPARRYYSRISTGDEDYFDFDLGHSIEMYRKWRNYVPRPTPHLWEHRLVRDLAFSQGVKPVAPYLFVRNYGDWRDFGTSYLSCALRTPTFWAQRFQNLGPVEKLYPTQW